MNIKKYSYVLFVIGILLILIFFLHNYISVFNNDGVINTDEYKEKDIPIKYDFVKMQDSNGEMKVLFPVFNEMKGNSLKNDDFYKEYESNDNFSLYAMVVVSNKSFEEYIDSQDNTIISYNNERGNNVKISNIECNNVCKRYEIIKNDGQLSLDRLSIYIMSSTNEIVEIIYTQGNKNISNNLIDIIIKNIQKKDA